MFINYPSAHLEARVFFEFNLSRTKPRFRVRIDWYVNSYGKNFHYNLYIYIYNEAIFSNLQL